MICVFVESWLTEKVQVQFPGFVRLRKDRQHSKEAGTIILIRNNFAYVEIEDILSPDDSVEICGIHLNNISPATDLIVCYRTPGFSLSQEQWDIIVSNVKQNNHSILLGDFNSHNTFWNCNYTDSNGSRFYNSIESHDLHIHNHNTFTHIDLYRNTKSNIYKLCDKMNGFACDKT